MKDQGGTFYFLRCEEKELSRLPGSGLLDGVSFGAAGCLLYFIFSKLV